LFLKGSAVFLSVWAEADSTTSLVEFVLDVSSMAAAEAEVFCSTLDCPTCLSVFCMLGGNRIGGVRPVRLLLIPQETSLLNITNINCWVSRIGINRLLKIKNFFDIRYMSWLYRGIIASTYISNSVTKFLKFLTKGVIVWLVDFYKLWYICVFLAPIFVGFSKRTTIIKP